MADLERPDALHELEREEHLPGCELREQLAERVPSVRFGLPLLAILFVLICAFIAVGAAFS